MCFGIVLLHLKVESHGEKYFEHPQNESSMLIFRAWAPLQSLVTLSSRTFFQNLCIWSVHLSILQVLPSTIIYLYINDPIMIHPSIYPITYPSIHPFIWIKLNKSESIYQTVYNYLSFSLNHSTYGSVCPSHSRIHITIRIYSNCLGWNRRLS